MTAERFDYTKAAFMHERLNGVPDVSYPIPRFCSFNAERERFPGNIYEPLRLSINFSNRHRNA